MTRVCSAWSIAKASPEEAVDALAIMHEVSQWLVETGRPLWPVGSFRLETFQYAALAGELVLGYQRALPVASMLLQTRDADYWPDDRPGEALYLHKIGVRRSAAGQRWLGRLIDWAGARAREVDAPFLRLDTARQLLPLYQSYGFTVVDREPRLTGLLKIYRLELRLSEIS